MRVQNVKICDGLSLDTDVSSDVVELDHILGFAIQAVWTGTPSGTLKLQAMVSGAGVWTDIEGSEIALAGVEGNQIWNVKYAFYDNVRVFYVFDNSDGVLDAWIYIKGV